MAVRKVGTCRIVGELGRGGMGVVLEGVQEGLDRRVAVKVLDARLARDPELSARFRREGQAYAQLRHEAVVTVYDLVEKEDTLYLLTELVDGPDLGRVLAKGGALPSDCLAVVGGRVAEALDYVHFHKLLHRDVKPSNVMISREGDVKLMDFGIAKDQRADDLTREGVVVGSPSYLAPEVLTGAEETVHSDLWGLGVTLYELATGRRPFKAQDNPGLFAAIRRGDFAPVRTLAPGVPRRLARAIERCLRKRPGARWPSAGALARELERCVGRSLGSVHPRARLVALLTHRGFMPEEEALSRIDARSLLASLVIDEASATPAPPARPRWHWAAVALVALAAGLAAWMVGW